MSAIDKPLTGVMSPWREALIHIGQIVHTVRPTKPGAWLRLQADVRIQDNAASVTGVTIYATPEALAADTPSPAPRTVGAAKVAYCSATEAQADDDRVLRSSVPERWKGCTSPVGAVQSYIAELEQRLKAYGEDPLEPTEAQASAQGSAGARAGDGIPTGVIDLRAIAKQAGISMDCWDMGAASLAYSKGCTGITREHLERFAALYGFACWNAALEANPPNMQGFVGRAIDAALGGSKS